MHAGLMQRGARGLRVRIRANPHQPLLEQQGVPLDPRSWDHQCDVQAQVALAPVDQQRALDVPLCDRGTAPHHADLPLRIRAPHDQKDCIAHASTTGFVHERLARMLLAVGEHLLQLRRQRPGLRCPSKVLLGRCERCSQALLAADNGQPRNMAQPLLGSEHGRALRNVIRGNHPNNVAAYARVTRTRALHGPEPGCRQCSPQNCKVALGPGDVHRSQAPLAACLCRWLLNISVFHHKPAIQICERTDT
mmetsp:Transcript_56380/g.177069  ORF Transcript_56380/g.177069 Transcript_56380/m.177069 type:complete len:249 (-) Transcript_56380:7-753(-)